jgi:hypothetical protein
LITLGHHWNVDFYRFPICLKIAFVLATLDDQNDSIMWENMLPEIRPKASRSLPDSTYLRALLNEPVGEDEPQLEFPKLTSKQRQFGVNPGYQSFNDPKIRYMAPYKEEFTEDKG